MTPFYGVPFQKVIPVYYNKDTGKLPLSACPDIFFFVCFFFNYLRGTLVLPRPLSCGVVVQI